MYYFDGYDYLTLGIALIFAGNLYNDYSPYSKEDPRIYQCNRTGKFSCKEEIERYLYHLDES